MKLDTLRGEPATPSPADLTPPPSRMYRDSFWLIWPAGRPELAERIGAATAQQAVERYADLARELPARVMICVDGAGQKLTHWSQAIERVEVRHWRMCQQPSAPGAEGP